LYAQYRERGFGLNISILGGHCIKGIIRKDIDESNILDSIAKGNVYLTKETGIVLGPVDLTFKLLGHDKSLSCKAVGFHFGPTASTPVYKKIRFYNKKRGFAQNDEEQENEIGKKLENLERQIPLFINNYCPNPN